MDMSDTTDIDEEPDVTVRLLAHVDELHEAITIFGQVWGRAQPLVGADVLSAIVHAGGYVAGAFMGNQMVGASFGFLARHRGEPALHSHMTGILPGVQHSGVGRSMKRQQRAWAAEHDLNWIVWTFDPLVRRNAWFNLEVLGASVHEYIVDMYGAIDDGFNIGDETDRLLAAWPTRRDVTPLGIRAVTSDITLVETPADIIELRRTDPDEARRWRLQVRDQLGSLIIDGGQVLGFTRDGQYQVMVPPAS